MKKLFFIAAIASAALAGCTKNEVTGLDGQQEITFVGPVVGAATKAVPGEMPAGYATAESFKVQAWYQEDAVSTTFDPTKTTQVYMDGSSASALCAI